ncbi:MAG: imidazole glycerol phosphate synthase, glutamine amidotransferase subunit [Alphaproteobacteria bacterium]|jgi:glutamine amidotransferase|nr:imidazole glycerol phosphate synthase, glutamine amidotransferase subunit [Alphaproteobacteria bacterium]
MSVVIIDYGSGNLRSAAKAFERAASEAGVDTNIQVTADPRVVMKATHIVLPGVGAFADCRAGLYAVPGMVAVLEREVIERGKPFMGICVGMQLMATRGLEHGVHAGLDWIKGDIVRVAPESSDLKVPQMGWNALADIARHPVLDGIEKGAHAYFVHSYKLDAADKSNVLATVDYGGAVAAVIGRDNMVGTQFHPEKSQQTGLRLIENFLNWRP